MQTVIKTSIPELDRQCEPIVERTVHEMNRRGVRRSVIGHACRDEILVPAGRWPGTGMSWSRFEIRVSR